MARSRKRSWLSNLDDRFGEIYNGVDGGCAGSRRHYYSFITRESRHGTDDAL